MSLFQPMAAGWTVSIAVQPCLYADFTKYMATWALYWTLQHTLTDTANQVWVRWALKLLNIKPRHVYKFTLSPTSVLTE